jgi:hypothetical protein
MNLQSLIVVAIRLIALNFLLQTAVQLTPPMLQYLQMHGASAGDGSDSFLVVPWLFLAAIIFCAAMLWMVAFPVAQFVTRGVSQDISFGSLSLIDCYSIAFIGVGVFYIAGYLPETLNWAHHFLRTAASKPQFEDNTFNPYDASRTIMSFIFGVILFVNGRRWAVALARKHEATNSSNRTAEPADSRTPNSR